jgi:hypothetical protein
MSTTVKLQGPIDDTGGTVTLVPDCVGVLDLNGQEVKVLNVVLGAESALTIRDTSGDSEGSLIANGQAASGSRAGIQTTGAMLTIEGGIVEAIGSNGGAGIGGGEYGDGGTVTITGGKVTATGDSYAAGIGGGFEGAGGLVTISGGDVTTFGDYGAAGIGGGGSDDDEVGGAGGLVTISGGTVTATGGGNGAGIGGGGSDDEVGGAGGLVTISGGTVTATGGGNGAGIGGGGSDSNSKSGGAGGTVTISLGTVTAIGGSGGAGIGGGSRGEGGTVLISGGEVTAEGRSSGAGIGGGKNGDGGRVTISGGVVEAIGDGDAAGIGGGTGFGGGGDGGVVIITGGTVAARTGTDGPGIGRGDRSSGSWDVRISGGSVTATAGAGGGGAGIGGGDEGPGTGGAIMVSGGTVEAFGGGSGGAGIGAGRKDGDGWLVTITGGSVEATAGSTDADAIGAGSTDQEGTLTVASAAVRADSVVGGLPFTRITFPSATTASTPSGPSFFAPGGVQPSQPTASAAFVRADGSPQQLAVSAPGRDRVRYEADGIRVTLQGGAGTDVARGLVANPAGEIACEVCVTGLTAGQVVEVWLFSTPRLVAAHLTDDAECQLFTVPLSSPLDGGGPVSAGAHTLQFTVGTSDGLEAVNVGLTVGGLVPTSVPAGEGPAMQLLLIVLGLVTFGLVAPVVLRRRVVTNA